MTAVGIHPEIVGWVALSQGYYEYLEIPMEIGLINLVDGLENEINLKKSWKPDDRAVFGNSM